MDQNLTIMDQGDYDTKTKSDYSLSPGLKLSSYGVSGNFDTSTTWDNSGRSTTGAATPTIRRHPSEEGENLGNL